MCADCLTNEEKRLDVNIELATASFAQPACRATRSGISDDDRIQLYVDARVVHSFVLSFFI